MILKIEFLIVGQGLAGSALALELLRRGKSLMMMDQPVENRATSRAAGLFNPVTGRVMRKTWKADVLFEFLAQFYIEAERKLGEKFFYPMPLYRPFAGIEEQNEWMGRSAERDVQTFIKQISASSLFGGEVRDPFGGLLLSRCGYLDVAAFMGAVRRRLIGLNAYREEFFDESKMDPSGNRVTYRDVEAQKVIYCNGYAAAGSRYFRGLPFKPLKGETLLIETQHRFDRIYNRGVFVVPTATPLTYKVGATYNPADLTPDITEKGRIELTEKLDALLVVPYKVITQDWGIRPSTLDRRPFLGPHPENGNVIIFNGLGTKGVSLAPYFAKQLADWLLDGKALEPEADISRFPDFRHP